MLKVTKSVKNKKENVLKVKNGKVYLLDKSSKHKELFNSLPEGLELEFYMLNIMKNADRFTIFDLRDSCVLKDSELTAKEADSFEFLGEEIQRSFYAEAGEKLTPTGFVKTYKKMKDVIPSKMSISYDRELLAEMANDKIQKMLNKGFILVDAEGKGVERNLLGKSVTIWVDFEGTAIGLFAPKSSQDEFDELNSQKSSLAGDMWYEIANEIGEDALLEKAHAYKKMDGGFYTSVDVSESEDGYRSSRSFEKRISIEEMIGRAAGAEFNSRKKAIEQKIKGMATEKVVLVDNLKIK